MIYPPQGTGSSPPLSRVKLPDIKDAQEEQLC
jgi:hypothetical protein